MRNIFFCCCYCSSLFVLLASCTSQPIAQQEKSPPPNVVLILADDLGYNDISSYRAALDSLSPASPTCQTPAIDRLAAEGMRFTDFYAGAAVCSPSRAALLTGRNCTRMGIYNWIPTNQPMHLRNEETTLAEMLKAAGYQTGHFGKWHLTSEGMGQPLPNDQGFDYSFFAYNNAIPSHKNPNNYLRNGEPVGELEGFACQLVVDEALSWLNQNQKDGTPFYLNVWFNEPHEKVEAPDSLKARHSYQSAYYGAIENMDMAINRILKHLKEKGLEKNTVVVFSSDNGSQVQRSNDPFRGEKCFNYEGGLRVPMVVRFPGKIPAGVVSHMPGAFPDVLPTVAALTEIAPSTDRKLDGVDLSPVLLGGAEKIDRAEPIFFYRYFHDPVCMLRQDNWSLLGFQDTTAFISGDMDQKALALLKPRSDQPRWGAWNFQPKHMPFIQNQKMTYFELYDLDNDPFQEHNLSDQYPEKVAELTAKMRQLRQEMVQEGGDWYAQ